MSTDSGRPLLHEVFNWHVDEFVTPRVFRALFLLVLCATTAAVGIGEFYLTRYLDFSFGLKLVLGLGLILVGIASILVVRVSYEMTLVFFKIERNTDPTGHVGEAGVD